MQSNTPGHQVTFPLASPCTDPLALIRFSKSPETSGFKQEPKVIRVKVASLNLLLTPSTLPCIVNNISLRHV